MALPTASDNPFPSILITEGTEPASPAAGKQRLYIDSTTHKLKRTDSSGTDVTIEATGAVATDAIFDAKGDLAVGTGADTASKLAVGTNDFVLTADSAQTTGVKWAAASGGSGTPLDGWNSTAALTYSSADSPTFVATTASDLTAVIPVGARVKLTQTTAKYFIVTAIDATTITLYGGTDYTLANAAITSPYYSLMKAPVGFPVSPAKWAVTTTDTSDRAQGSPSSGTWYNLGTLSISIPIGVWRVYYQVTLDADGSNAAMYVTLSTANNSESDNSTTCISFSSTSRIQQFETRETLIALAAKASRFLNAKTSVGGLTSIDFRGDLETTVIKAVCVYL